MVDLEKTFNKYLEETDTLTVEELIELRKLELLEQISESIFRIAERIDGDY